MWWKWARRAALPNVCRHFSSIKNLCVNVFWCRTFSLFPFLLPTFISCPLCAWFLSPRSPIKSKQATTRLSKSFQWLISLRPARSRSLPLTPAHSRSLAAATKSSDRIGVLGWFRLAGSAVGRRRLSPSFLRVNLCKCGSHRAHSVEWCTFNFFCGQLPSSKQQCGSRHWLNSYPFSIEQRSFSLLSLFVFLLNMHGIIALWQRLAPFHHRNMPRIYSFNICVFARPRKFSHLLEIIFMTNISDKFMVGSVAGSAHRCGAHSPYCL